MKPVCKRAGRAWRSGGIVLLFALGAGACAKVAVVPPRPAPPEGFVRGVLAADNTLGVSLAGAEARMGGGTATVSAAGTFSFPRPAPGKYFVVVEKRFETGPVRRVMGVSTVYVADYPVDVRVRLRDATDIDAFCSDCHPVKGKVTRRDQVIRDVHPSGIVPRKANKPTGRYDDRGRVTCESCHTVHQPTAYPHFTLASFRDGKLCLECH